MDDSPMLHPRIETPKSTYCRLFLYNTEAEEWSEQRGCCLGKELLKGSKRKGGGLWVWVRLGAMIRVLFIRTLRLVHFQ